jgi:release factor glutamine methyltransferase
MAKMVREALEAGRRALAGAGSAVRDETPALDAEVLLRCVLGAARAELFTYPERPLTAEAWGAYHALLARRRAGEPVAYLTGRREFMGLDFLVDGRVLIPRPETETLVERALERLRAAGGPGAAPVAADPGTGSGAIAVSLAAHLPGLRVYATDVSAAALEVARTNAARLLGPERTRVTFRRAALLDGTDEALQVIAANLPYVPTSALPGLPPTVRRFEPWFALDGGADGLDCYRALLPQARARLVAGGTLLMECDPAQAAALQRLALAAFPRASGTIVHDLGGRARVVEVQT